MGTISCHSNQTYVTGIKKAFYAAANVINMYAKFLFCFVLIVV